MNLVSVALCSRNGDIIEGWLADGSDNERIANLLKSYTDYTMVCFNADAEARCFVALGLNPLDFKWIDLYLDYKQLQNKDMDYLYGRYIEKNIWGKYIVCTSEGRKTTEGYIEEDELNRLNAIHKARMAMKNKTVQEVTSNLLNATANFVKCTDDKLIADAVEKDKVRGMIIERKSREFTEDEKQSILSYGRGDIADMDEMLINMGLSLEKTSGQTQTEVLRHRLFRGRVGAMMAVVSSNGTPISRERLQRLMANASEIENTAKAHLNEVTGLPICQWDLKGKASKCVSFDKFIVKKSVLEEYILDTDMAAKWPRGKSGLKFDSDTISKYENVPVIEDYRQCQKVISAMKYSKPSVKKKTRTIDAMGSDNRLRCSLFPYGTQTARNAPRATSYIYAQGAWMKCLIEIPKGKVLVETDYGSQEFLIGGIMSEDEKMIEAYKTDVYISFGIDAGQYPSYCKDLSVAEIKKLGHSDNVVADVRQRLKGVVLGLSYGAGAETISLKTGMTMDVVEKLVTKYKRIYRKYYSWRDQVWDEHKSKARSVLTMPISGWYLGRNNDNKLSTMNFPVQATGATLLHVALDKVLTAGFEVVNTLHDAVYYLVDEDKWESEVKKVEDLMLEASVEVLGADGMKIESEHWMHGGRVITPKGHADYQKFSKFVEDSTYKFN